MAYTIPSDTHTAGNSGHVTDHNNIADMLTLISDANVKNTAYSGGATGNGVTDDTAAINAAINAAAAGAGITSFPGITSPSLCRYRQVSSCRPPPGRATRISSPPSPTPVPCLSSP